VYTNRGGRKRPQTNGTARKHWENQKYFRTGVETMEKECVICGKVFEPKVHNAVTCCEECGKENHRRKALQRRIEKIGNKEPITLECAICGKLFEPQRITQKTCCEECRKAYHKKYQKSYQQKWYKPLEEKECVICGKLFQQKCYNSNTCSEECRREQKRRIDRKSKENLYQKQKQAEMERRNPKPSKLDRFTGEIALYNRKHGTNLSYGMYVLYKEMGRL
jgi:predicted nucleic acid-binding Zn ribbon protein